MPRKHSTPRQPAAKPSLKLVANNMPRAEEYQDIIAIIPSEQGVFAWVVEDRPPTRPFRF